MRDWASTVHHDDQGPLAADEVYEELKKGVNGEGFVYVAERVDPCGRTE
jgi:hypothetical protein